MTPTPCPFERTATGGLRPPAAAAHVQRQMSVPFRLCATTVAVSLASAASFGQSVGGGVQTPSVIGKSGCGPNYPAESMRREESGTVRVKALVEADGVPSQTKVEGSSGFERLDRAVQLRR